MPHHPGENLARGVPSVDECHIGQCNQALLYDLSCDYGRISFDHAMRRDCVIDPNGGSSRRH